MSYRTGAMAESMSKVKKSRNFSAAEVEVLIENVEKYKTILNSRLKNSVTNADKRRVWEKICTRINAVSCVTRTADQVKKKWSDVSSQTKCKEAVRRRERRLTGGGNQPSELSQIEQKVVGILGETAISGVTGGIDSSRPQTAEDSDSEDSISDGNSTLVQDDTNINIHVESQEQGGSTEADTGTNCSSDVSGNSTLSPRATTSK